MTDRKYARNATGLVASIRKHGSSEAAAISADYPPFRESHPNNFSNVASDAAHCGASLEGETAASISNPPLQRRRTTASMQAIRRSQSPQGLRIPAFISTYGVGRSTVYKLIAEGKLARLKVGRCTLIDAEDAQRWWRECVRGQS